MNYIDTETYSETPINHGTYRYTSNCEAMLVSYALGERAPVECWDRTTGEPMPDDLAFVLDDPDELWTAHNAMFDRNVLRESLQVEVAIPRWRCTMVRALCHGLPGGLDPLSEIFNLGAFAKEKSGRRFIHLFCKPRKDQPRATRWTHVGDWEGFIQYAKGDIHAMRALDQLLPRWNYRGDELASWHLDQVINDRGIGVDVDFATAAIKAVNREQRHLARETQERTDGVVQSATLRDQLLAYITMEYGVTLPDMQKATLERRVKDLDLPLELRELLAIRLQAAGTSVHKYKALINGVNADGRLRGTLQFSGASRTRRWAGRTFQPQNLPRPDMLPANIETGIEAIKLECDDELYNDVPRLARNAIRGVIVPKRGNKLVIADYSNIEGRLAAWLAGEDWKLDAYRAYDAGVGLDLYKVSYSNSFRIDPEDVTTPQRQIGKVQELLLQYQGGVAAWITGALVYDIDLEALAKTAWSSIPVDIMEQTQDFIEWMNKHHPRRYPISHEARTICEAFKIMWRRDNPMISSLWPDMENAARDAIQNPGKPFVCRKFTMQRDGAWLRIKLPGGKYLCYPHPEVNSANRISYMGVSPYTKQWQRLGIYGGKFLENACQALGGDVLKAAMPGMEAHGYQIVFTVHDEPVTETPDTPKYSAAELCGLLIAGAPWMNGLPLAAKGFETYRFRKAD